MLDIPIQSVSPLFCRTPRSASQTHLVLSCLYRRLVSMHSTTPENNDLTNRGEISLRETRDMSACTAKAGSVLLGGPSPDGRREWPICRRAIGGSRYRLASSWPGSWAPCCLIAVVVARPPVLRGSGGREVLSGARESAADGGRV
jgi:hypothetical protein